MKSSRGANKASTSTICLKGNHHYYYNIRDVEKCMDDLRNSIECGRKWKKIYEKTAFVINKKAT
jgi:hypothetical protein